MAEKGWQTHWHKHPGVRSGADLTLGERAADRMRNVMGSWPFVFGFFAVMAAWVVINSVLAFGGTHGFDPEIAIHTERNTDDIKDLIAQNLHLVQEVKRQTDLLDEIHRHVSGLGKPGVPAPPAES